MRILEKCIDAWPLPEIQSQIQSLRQAFSADLNKPFELKPSFPYGSPVARMAPSPPLDIQYQERMIKYSSPQDHAAQLYHAPPITPPISAGNDDEKHGSLTSTSLNMMSDHRQQLSGDDGSLGWNPTRIFEYGAKFPQVDSVRRPPANNGQSQWTNAFGTPTSTMSATATQHSPTMYNTPSTVSSHDLPHLQDTMQQPMYPLPVQQMTSVPQSVHHHAPSYTSVGPSFVSPSMWQDTVASTYDSAGLKRRWDMTSSYFNDSQQVKRPR